MRDSFIFYRSFYEALNELENEDKLLVYEAISEYSLNQTETELKGIPKAIFTLIKPQLDANSTRYDNGKKGGAPKGNTNAKKTTEKQPKNNRKTTEKQPNKNVNVNVNDNVNDNEELYEDTIFDYIQKTMGIILNGADYEIINEWEDNSLTRYAIREAGLNKAQSVKYISKILLSYKAKGIKTVEDIKQKENKSINLYPQIEEKTYL